ncbi:MAG: MFS transporter [Candidatus Babeliales bacterium]|jgi:MFS family permease
MKDQSKNNGIANVIWLGLASLLNDISSEMILPILPQLITGAGGTGIALGLIGGLRDSAAELLKVFFGRLSDKFGERKFFIYSGYATSAIFKLFLIFARTWYVIFGLVGLERLGKAIRTSPRDALITQTLPNNVGKGFGIHRAFDTLGAIGGSALAFYFVWHWHTTATFIIVLAAIISLISIVPLIPVTDTPAPQPLPNGQEKLRFSDFVPPFKLFTLIATIFSYSRISYLFFVVDAQQVLSTISPLQTAMLLYVLFNIFYTLFAIPCGMLSDKIGRWRMLVLGYALFALMLFGFVIAQSITAFISCFILYGIALAIIQVAHKAYAADLAPAHLKATYLGTFESITGLAILTTGGLSGYAWDKLSHHAVFVGTGALALTACVLMIVYKEKLSIAR